MTGRGTLKSQYMCHGRTSGQGGLRGDCAEVAALVLAASDAHLQQLRTRILGAPPPAQQLAADGREAWRQAALAFVDGRLNRAQYERRRARARESLAQARTAQAMPLARLDACLAALHTGDVVQQRNALAEVLHTVVPERVRRGVYEVRVQWATERGDEQR